MGLPFYPSRFKYPVFYLQQSSNLLRSFNTSHRRRHQPKEMNYVKEEEQGTVINADTPAPQHFLSTNRFNGILIRWGKQKRLRCCKVPTVRNNNNNNNNANSSSSFVQPYESPKSSIEEEEVGSQASVTKTAIKQVHEEEEVGSQVSVTETAIKQVDDEEAEDTTEEEIDMNQKRKRYTSTSTSTSLISTCTSARKQRKQRKGENN